MTIGADVAINVSTRVSIVPDVRFHLIGRPDVATSIGEFLSLSPYVFRAAVGIRANF